MQNQDQVPWGQETNLSVATISAEDTSEPVSIIQRSSHDRNKFTAYRNFSRSVRGKDYC